MMNRRQLLIPALTVLPITAVAQNRDSDHPLAVPFNDAIKRGDLAGVRAFLKLGVPTAPTKGKPSALLIAVIWRRVAVVEELLSHGVPVDIGHAGMTPLAFAYARGFPEVSAVLLASGARFSGIDRVNLFLLAPELPPPDQDPKFRNVDRGETGKQSFHGVWDLDNQRSGLGKGAREGLQIDHLGKYILVHRAGKYQSDESIRGYVTDGRECRVGRLVHRAKWVETSLEIEKLGKTSAEVERWAIVDQGVGLQIATGSTTRFFKRTADDTYWHR